MTPQIPQEIFARALDHQRRHKRAVASDPTGQGPVSELPARKMRMRDRIFAGCLDVAVYGLLTALWFAVFTMFSDALLVAAFSGWFVCTVLIETFSLTKSARTPGKYAAGLLVIDAKPGSFFMSWKQVAVRSLTKTSVLYGLGILLPVLLNYVDWINTPLWFGVPITFVLLLFILGVFRKDRRGVHDLIAQTKVIRV